MLARMFATDQSATVWGNSVDPRGAYLVDRSPRHFEPILNYLRHGQLILDPGVNPQGELGTEMPAKDMVTMVTWKL